MCAVARRGLSALRLPIAASWAGSGALGPLIRLLISCLPTGGFALRNAHQSYSESQQSTGQCREVWMLPWAAYHNQHL